MEWTEVLSNPLLQNLPFKIELNRFGTILISGNTANSPSLCRFLQNTVPARANQVEWLHGPYHHSRQCRL